MTPSLINWAERHGVSLQAMLELRAALAAVPELSELDRAAVTGKNEAFVQNRLRTELRVRGFYLFRNNVGALKDERGVPVRYGLANDTPALNKAIKSGDLIGWRQVIIGPEHLGQPFARFVSVECKEPGWRGVVNDREKAQQRWLELVNAQGGEAYFSTGGLPA